MSHRKYKEPCSRFITAGDTHDRCLGLHHVLAALSCLSTCPHCEGLRLKVLCSRVEVFSKVAPRPNPAVSLLQLPRRRTRRWFGATWTVRTVMCWSFLYFTCSPPFECKRSAKTSWSLLFSSTRIYGPPQRPTVQSPLAAGCRTTMFCQPRPRGLRIYCPAHADLSLLADMRDTAPRPTASCWTWSLAW